MNIATRIFFVFLVILGLLCAIVISMTLLADSRKKTAEAKLHLLTSYKLVNQLRQTSDDLTRMARSFVMTGDAVYEQYFHKILAIRDGKLPPPGNYDASYWRFVTAKDLPPNLPAGSMPLLEMIKQSGITDKELSILEQSGKNADLLNDMEKMAFDAIKGLLPENNGNMAVSRNPDPEYARSLLYGKRYYRIKAELMQAVQRLNTLINDRVYREIDDNKATEDLYWKITALLIIITILFSVLAFLFFRTRVVRPIVSLSKIARKIQSGKTDERATVSSQDEIGILNGAFNNMVEARLKCEQELESNEKSLKTTLDSMGDAMITTDISGQITRMNPIAEKLCGWKTEDAINRPLPEVFHIVNARTGEIADNPVDRVLSNGEICDLPEDTTLIAKDGTEYQIADSAAPIWDETSNITGVVLVFHDITDEYACRRALHESEERYRKLFENTEVPMCNEDLSEIYKALNKLRNDGVKDLRQYLKDNRDAAWNMAGMIRILQANNATLRLFETDDHAKLISKIDTTFGLNAIDVFIDELCAIWDRKDIFRSEVKFRTFGGKDIDVIISFQIPRTEEGFKNISFSIIDITDQKKSEAELRESEERFKRLFENSEVSICNEDLSEVKAELEKIRQSGVQDFRQYLKDNQQILWQLVNMVKVIQVNDATLKLFGATSDKNFIRQFDKTFGPNAIEIFTDGLCAIWDGKKVYRAVSDFRTLSGKLIKAIISYPIPETTDGFKSIPVSIIDITELKKAESAQKESEASFRRLFENAGVSIWNEDMSKVCQTLEGLRRDGVEDLRQYLEENPQAARDMANSVRIIQVNDATLKLFGGETSEKFIPLIDNIFGPNSIKTFTDELCAIWDKKKFFHAEADFKTLDGKTINAIISYQIPETPEGFKSFPICIIDITELKKAEEAMKESEERLSLHLENTPLAVIAWDKDLNCIQWNPAAEKIYGYTQEEALGKHAVDLLVPKGFDAEMNDVLASLMQQTGGSHSINDSVTKDGRTITCEWFNTPLIDKTGKSIGIASMGQDITKHKQADDELRKLSIVVEQSPASIVITDANGIVEYVNPKFEEITGYTAKEVIGQYNRLLRTEYTAGKEYGDLWETVNAGKYWRGEFHSKHKNGSLYWESTLVSPITDKDGTITHFLVVMEDITERRQLESHLRRSQKMEAVGELAGGIAHDFNNLLGIIIGNLDLMKRKISEDSKIQNNLEKAQSAALRGSSLTRRLLNFSQQSPEASSPVNINKIIVSLEDLVSRSLTGKITHETSLARDLWMVELNTGDFEDMLINLSLNARDAMPDGGRLIIETRNTIIDHITTIGDEDMKPGDYVEIAISDTGSGIPKNLATKIFDPFFTTKDKDKGTGLGLAMVYSFVQRSKGHISVQSEEGIGTTFRIYLPRSITMAQRMEELAKPDISLPRGTETILIVDDEEELVTIAKTILEELGYKTICVYGADQALQILEDNPDIDLLFSDVIMAGSLNGFELARAATGIRPDLKILLTSGFTGQMQNLKADEQWGKTLITKPYRDIELAKRIRDTLDNGDGNE